MRSKARGLALGSSENPFIRFLYEINNKPDASRGENQFPDHEICSPLTKFDLVYHTWLARTFISQPFRPFRCHLEDEWMSITDL